MATAGAGRLPNFLHLGPGKSGSTWFHEVLSLHPQVYLSEAKDLYYFSRFYDRGLDWYAAQFVGAGPQHLVVGEVCPDYLLSPGIGDRIHDSLGDDVRLMVTLRDPIERAFSSYLYLRKHGLAAPSFRATLQAEPMLLDEGRYGSKLAGLQRHYRRDAIHVAMFDDLQRNPQLFLDEATDWLGIERLALDPELQEARLPASKARLLPLAKGAQRAAEFLRKHDGAQVVGRVKRSAMVQRALYKPLGDDRPTLSPADAAYVRDQLENEIITVEQRYGLDLRRRWAWH